MLSQIFIQVILPLLGAAATALTAIIIKYVNDKSKVLKEETDNQLKQKYIDMLAQTIEDCVVSTNQTYVDSLKNKKQFTKEAEKEAFNQTYEKIVSILNDESKKYLKEVYGDLDVYITTKIEAEVNFNKEKNNEQKNNIQ